MEGVGPRQGPKRGNPASHLTWRGLGEDRSGNLEAGLPALALRSSPSLLLYGPAAGMEMRKSEGCKTAPIHLRVLLIG